MPKKKQKYLNGMRNLRKNLIYQKYDAKIFALFKHFVNLNLTSNCTNKNAVDTQVEVSEPCLTQPQAVHPPPEQWVKDFDSTLEEIRLQFGYEGCWIPVYSDVTAFIQLYILSNDKDKPVLKEMTSRQERTLKTFVSRKRRKEIELGGLSDEEDFEVQEIEGLPASRDTSLSIDSQSLKRKCVTTYTEEALRTSVRVSKKTKFENENDQNKCESCLCQKKSYTPASCRKNGNLLKQRVLALEKLSRSLIKSSSRMEGVMKRLSNLEHAVQSLVNNQSSKESHCESKDSDVELPAEHNSWNSQSEMITVKTEISLDDFTMEESGVMSENMTEECQDPLAFDQLPATKETSQAPIVKLHMNDKRTDDIEHLNANSAPASLNSNSALASLNVNSALGQIFMTPGPVAMAQQLQSSTQPKRILVVHRRKTASSNSTNLPSTSTASTTTSKPFLLTIDAAGNLLAPSWNQNQGPGLLNSKTTSGTSQLQNQVKSSTNSLITSSCSPTAKTKNTVNNSVGLKETPASDSKMNISYLPISPFVQQKSVPPDKEDKARIFYKLPGNWIMCGICRKPLQPAFCRSHKC